MLKTDRHYKERLVAKGCTQVQGIDYEATFSPVARYKSIRYLLAHATLQDWDIKAMDVKLAYLHRVLEEEIYMEQPEGFIAQGEEDKVCRLMHSLYRLKQAGQVWNRTFAHTIKRKLCFNIIHSNAGVYILHHHYKRGDSETDMILILYVDNVLLLGEDLSKIEDIKHQLGKLYQMNDLGPASFYLGIQVTRDQNTWAIQIDQQAYIENALKRFELLDANSTNTPLPAGIHLEKSEEPVALNTKTYYQQIIRTLIYATVGTRPDIAFAAMILSWFNNNPMKEHIKYTKYILQYLKGTREFKIKYDRSSDAGLIRYSDPDWGENSDDCHSTSGHIFLMANGAISWESQWQKMVALSVGEAEYMELAITGWQAAWLRSFSREIGFPIKGPIPLCSDNQAVIFLMVNPTVKHQTKYINIQHHYIQEQYENNPSTLLE